MDEITHIHFCSWATRLSVELPVGFEEQLEDAEQNTAIYADDLDDDEPGARVMTRMTAVATGEDDALRSLAAASAQVGTRTIEHREEREVDGAPAIVQELRYHDDELEVDVVRLETHAQVANVIFSMICLTPASRFADYAAAFDHASRTARIVLVASERERSASSPRVPASFSHAATRISAIVPESWEIAEPSEQTVRLMGPAPADGDGSRPSVSIALGEPDGFEPDGFGAFCEASVRRLEQQTPGFTLRAIERYELSSLVDLHAVWYSSRWDSNRELVQLQALGLLDRYHLYLVNAAAPLALAERYAPLMDAILRSLRVLPAVS